MKQPNVSLKFAAAAIEASNKAQRANTKTVRAYFQKKAQQYLMKAAAAKDAGAAVRIINASNRQAIKASKAVNADLEDDMMMDPVEDIVVDDDVDMVDDVVLGSEEDEDEDTEDEKDDEDEVDARLASILARTRARRMKARMQAKRQLRR